MRTDRALQQCKLAFEHWNAFKRQFTLLEIEREKGFADSSYVQQLENSTLKGILKIELALRSVQNEIKKLESLEIEESRNQKESVRV